MIMKSISCLFMLACSASAFAQLDQQQMSKGEYVAIAGNCAACHTIEGGAAYAGGLKMAVPMLGKIYTTNITPDVEHGIGSYSFADFDAAMRDGVAKEGHYLYPAMPYPSYAKMTDEDMRALYDYFMNEVQPVAEPNLDAEIPGLLSFRWPLGIWNALFLDNEPYADKTPEDDAWNRGAYLVQGLGHCGACHSPRGIFMQESSYDESSSEFLAGAELDHWSASSLNGDINSGLGRWTVAETVEYLKTGKNRFSTAFGSMVEVINSSTQHLADDDLQAIAVYLKSLPPWREQGAEPYRYDPAETERLRKMDFATPGSDIYYRECIWCHMPDGSGLNKFQPTLAGNPAVLDPEPASTINVTLNGSLRLVVDGKPEPYDMPPMRQLLTDEEAAAVITYIRTSWGNKASPVTAEEVAQMREATDPVHHDIVVLQMQ